MCKLGFLIVFQFIVFSVFTQKSNSKIALKSIFFSVNEGIIDKKVLLFDGSSINYDYSKDLEFIDYGFDKTDSCKKPPISISADKLNWERLVKKNPKLANQTMNTIVRVDPISGDPVVYSTKRLKEYYLAWKKEFFFGKQIVRNVENDSSSLVVFSEKLLGRNIYIGMYIQIRSNKIQIVLRDLGKVRRKDKPNEKEVFASFCYHIPELDKHNNWRKVRSILKFKKRMENVSQNLMDFILNEGDFVERVLDNKLYYYVPRFNF